MKTLFLILFLNSTLAYSQIDKMVEQPNFKELNVDQRSSLGKIRRLNEIETHMVKLTAELERLKAKVAMLEAKIQSLNPAENKEK